MSLILKLFARLSSSPSSSSSSSHSSNPSPRLADPLHIHPSPAPAPTSPPEQVKVESNFAAVCVAIMVLEGVGRNLDPSLDILAAAAPVLARQAAAQILLRGGVASLPEP